MNPILDESNFVAGDIVEKDVVLGDGKAHKLKFKRITGVEQYAFVLAQRTGDEDAKARSIARMISVCLVDDTGKPILTVEKAMQLRDDVLANLLQAATEVNQEIAEKKA